MFQLSPAFLKYLQPYGKQTGERLISHVSDTLKDGASKAQMSLWGIKLQKTSPERGLTGYGEGLSGDKQPQICLKHGQDCKPAPSLHPELGKSIFSSPALPRDMLIPHNKTFCPAHQCLQNIFFFFPSTVQSLLDQSTSAKAAARTACLKQQRATAYGVCFFLLDLPLHLAYPEHHHIAWGKLQRGDTVGASGSRNHLSARLPGKMS